VGKLAARRKRNKQSESRAGCAAPTRQLKAANRTCGKLATCNLGWGPNGEISESYFCKPAKLFDQDVFRTFFFPLKRPLSFF
jgi:hypothetical protein